MQSSEGRRSEYWRGEERKKKQKERRSHPSKLKGETRERERVSKTHIPSGFVIKTGDNKYVMGAFSTKCGCLSFLEMGPQGDRPRKND